MKLRPGARTGPDRREGAPRAGRFGENHLPQANRRRRKKKIAAEQNKNYEDRFLSPFIFAVGSGLYRPDVIILPAFEPKGSGGGKGGKAISPGRRLGGCLKEGIERCGRTREARQLPLVKGGCCPWCARGTVSRTGVGVLSNGAKYPKDAATACNHRARPTAEANLAQATAPRQATEGAANANRHGPPQRSHGIHGPAQPGSHRIRGAFAHAAANVFLTFEERENVARLTSAISSFD